MKPDRPLSPKEFARYLRKNLTKEERIMWDLLRNRKFHGYKFLRQHPIKVWDADGLSYYYYADFYCAEKRIVVEIDGAIHELQKEYDNSRDIVMKELGLRVLRVKNEAVMGNIDGVLQKIKELLDSSSGSFSTSRERE